MKLRYLSFYLSLHDKMYKPDYRTKTFSNLETIVLNREVRKGGVGWNHPPFRMNRDHCGGQVLKHSHTKVNSAVIYLTFAKFVTMYARTYANTYTHTNVRKKCLIW